MTVAYPELKKFGLEDGDIPIMVGDQKLKSVHEAFRIVLIDGERKMTVLRNGEKTTISLPKNFDQLALKNKYTALYQDMRIPAVVNEVAAKSNAAKAGLQKGDSIVAVNGQPTIYFNDVQAVLQAQKNKKISLVVSRKGNFTTLNSKVDEKGTIGFRPEAYDYYGFKFETEKFTLLQSFPEGANMGVNMLSNYVKSLSLIFTKEGATQVGGFGSMGKIFPSEWNWQIFWLNTAMISVILAFMNILPIPALDGGHVVFLLYEIVTGREAPQKVLEYAQYVGIILLLALMLYANGNDVYKAITGQ